MSIKSIFQDIAAAIKTKDSSVVTVTPQNMPNAILNIQSGGAELIDKTVWDSMTTEEKRQYNYVGVKEFNSGYIRGTLVYGADFGFSWRAIKSIIIGGRVRSSSSQYAQLGDIRFKDTNNNYLPSQYNNVSSSATKYGGFLDNNCRALYDNNTSTKCITNGAPNFEWTAIFTDTIDIKNYTTIELWTAGDASERDPYTNVFIAFVDINNFKKIFTIGNTNMTTSRYTLGYTNSNYQNEAIEE